MMNDALIQKYIGDGMAYSDFAILNEVDFDNVSYKLNQLCFGKWSYDVDIMSQKENGEMIIKVSLYCPMKHVCGFAITNITDINNGIKIALVDAVKCGFNFKDRHSDETPVKTPAIEKTKHEENNTNALTTLEEIDKMEKEIGMQVPEKTQDEQVQNPFGIRKDQIDFIKLFQGTFKIDNEEKFDSYVATWNNMRETGICTKKQLVACGANAVDDFISWVKEVYKDNLANNSFVCPSDTEFGASCGN